VRKSRRQIANRVIEAIGVTLVALDLVIFFAVYRPLGDKLAAEARIHEELRQTAHNQQVRVELLKKFEATVPSAGKGLDDFITNRIPPRREAFSTAAHLIHRLADASSVKVTTLAYHLDTDHHDPLERLQLDISAQGSYAGLLKFSHALETANDFVLVREFTLSPGDNGALSLRLGADVYVTP
jgi:Tfp pilus assembly protein PilO